VAHPGQPAAALAISRFAHNCMLGWEVCEADFMASEAFPGFALRKVPGMDEGHERKPSEGLN